MAGYLLDTNHISPLVTLPHPLRRRVLGSLQAGDTFSIAVPALTEMLFGISIEFLYSFCEQLLTNTNISAIMAL